MKQRKNVKTYSMKKLIAPLTVLALSTTIAAPALAQCKVQKNESLWSIAKEYHLDFAELCKLNAHLPNISIIMPGQQVNTQNDTGTGNDATGSHDNQGNGNTTDSTTASEKITSSGYAQEILQLVNQERSKQGLKALQLDSKLNQVATVKAKDMASNHYFSHDSPTYGTPFDMMHSFNVSYRSAGENIAAGQKTAQEVMNSWMNSAGHRANILNKNYTHLGVGYCLDSDSTPYWCQEFVQQ